MPYPTNAELPESVKARLPDEAQDIYRSAFNRAWQVCADPEDRSCRRRTEVARRIAWAAVQRSYEKVGDGWKRRH